MENKEINILDYFLILYNSRYYIVINLLIVCFIAGAVSMVLPKYYESKVTMLPPSESTEGFGLGQAMSMLPVNISLGGQGTPSDIAMGIMKSKTVANTIIDRFNLIEEYDSKDRDAAQLSLNTLTNISLTKEGLIQVIVEDRDKERAAAIANMYCAMLDSLNKIISQDNAASRAKFLKEQLDENEAALKEAEAALNAYQMKTNALSPYHQQRVAISVTAELEMEIMRKDRLLEEYRAKSLSDTHPLVKDVLDSKKILEKQLSDMRYGVSEDERESLFVPLESTPEMTMEYSKLVSRVESLNQLSSILNQQYEEARIEQKNPISTINIVDSAKPALRKSRPKRKLIVIVAAAVSLFFSIVSIVTVEFFNRLTELNPENREKVRRLARFLHINS